MQINSIISLRPTLYTNSRLVLKSKHEIKYSVNLLNIYEVMKTSCLETVP